MPASACGRQQLLHEGSHADVVAQVLHRPARSLHHVAFQLIAVLRRLSDVLQGRVCHTRLKKSTLPPCELSSYRPISNLSFLSKLLERVVSVQLTGYLSL